MLLENRIDHSIFEKLGLAALHFAASRGHKEVQTLLENGIDHSIVEKDGWTVLHEAAAGGHEEVVRMVLENGEDNLILYKDGWTTLHLASEAYDPDCSQFSATLNSKLTTPARKGLLSNTAHV